MISRLFRPRAKTKAPTAPTVPPATVVWAVGDIHGRFDLLHPLVKAIARDLHDSPAERKIVIFLGDYIDRGPDSRSVLLLLAGLSSSTGVEWRFLKGNHEQVMLEFLDDPSRGPVWCEHGGDRALQSYGLGVPELAHRAEAWARVSADLRHRLTSQELLFLRGLETSITVGDYFFAHAGARPGLALDRQSPQDLMWIRQPFLEDVGGFDRIVVHGHTPSKAVYGDHRRIGIDTKAYASGVLSALRLERREQSIVQAIGLSRTASARSGREPQSDVGIAGVVIQRQSITEAGVSIEAPIELMCTGPAGSVDG